MKKEVLTRLLGMFILITIATIFLTFSAKAAEQEGCCLDTGLGQQCVTTARDECPGRFFTGPPYDCSNIQDCKAGTCIPKEKAEACIRNKASAECIALGGVPDSRQLEDIPQCVPGCCVIANGVKAEVLQFKQCENLTQALGYSLDMMEFHEGIISQVECKKVGSPSDLGCCVMNGGNCKYGARSECGTEGSFVPLAGGMFCRDVAQCALTKHSYYDCGKIPGSETDVYWYDSNGNQEEVKDSCGYPEKLCTKTATQKAYCKTTTCTFSGTSQKMSSTPPKVDDDIITNEKLLTGTSICYNFYTSYIGKDESATEADSYLQRRSTGLQNQILHCAFNKIELEGLGTDREKLCVPADPAVQGPSAAFHANVRENKWINCSSCGKNTGLLGDIGDSVGDFLGPSTGLPWGKAWSSILGAYCTKDKCTKLGDCYYHEDLPAALGGTGAGSCDPIYPPGAANSKCGECGGGGDSIWNLCTRAECYSKGDCQFQAASSWTKWGTFMWFWPGMAISERTSLTIPECILTTAVYCPAVCSNGVCASDPACYIPANNNFLKCLGDRSLAYSIYGLAWVGTGKLINFAWSALSSKVTDTLTSQANVALTNFVSGKTTPQEPETQPEGGTKG
ncbi:MAG: hypothetical protein NTX24_00150 [Candidatus Pacearchaeota archaeon]|nr:hypothetical protein [Candidatus Pacearchaeota archaeon]